MSIPRPENIGDIYRAIGYQQLSIPRYGVVYRASDPTRPGYVCWWIEMDDGDIFPWPADEEMPDMFAEGLELVSRNPLSKGEARP